jgi:CheY-like chemotaxis protein
LLGGEIQLRSNPGAGSAFTLFLPLTYAGSTTARVVAEETNVVQLAEVAAVRRGDKPAERLLDDREEVAASDLVLLVVEDDPHYSRILMDLAHDRGFKVIVAQRGSEALALAQEYQPTAMSLDIFLPDMLGWSVLSQLKQNVKTRHIPVQIVSLDDDRQHGLTRGAFAFLKKPATSEGLGEALSRLKTYAQSRRRRLLVVDDNEAERASVAALLGHDDIEIESVGSGGDALASLKRDPADCVVLDLTLPDMSGFDVLEKMHADGDIAEVPVVVFTGRELSPDDDSRLHSMARSVVVKGVESPERLLDETALFLHRVVADLPSEKQRMLQELHSSDESLVGETVLLVDDDARNIFALIPA